MKKYISAFLYICLSAITLTLSGCGIYGKYHPTTEVPDNLYGNVQSGDSAANFGLVRWQDVFTDPYLQQLIEKALSNNLDLKIAREHVKQAEAGLLGAKLAYLPTISLVPSAGFSPQYDIKQGNYDLVAQAQWEIDIFGRTLNGLRGAKAAKRMTEDYEQAARCGLIAAVAEVYYTLLMLDAQLATAEQTSVTWSKTANTIKRMKQAGMANEAAVAQLEATQYAINTQVIAIKESINAVENSMSLLLGGTRMEIKRNTLADQTLPTDMQTGFPVQLLYNRPDVMAAQEAMAQAFYATNLARSNCLPSLNLSGLIGWTNHSYNVVLDPMTLISSLAASLFVPIFNSGRNIAQVRAAKSQQEESVMQFTKVVLAAGNEVNEALVKYQTCEQKSKLYDKQVEALTRAMNSTQLTMQHGSTTYLEVLNAQNTLLNAQLTQIANQTEQNLAVVKLYHALGGGKE